MSIAHCQFENNCQRSPSGAKNGGASDLGSPAVRLHSGFIELVRLADVLLKRASSNLVLCYVAELLACVLALVFIVVAYIAVSVAIALAFAAVALAVCLAGLPFIIAGSSYK